MNPTYLIEKSYQWNYDNGPIFEGELPQRTKVKPIKLWNYEIASPIGIPAGPLLNANFIGLYARLGFDLPVYKTVRTVKREAHLNPNCLYLNNQKSLTENDILAETTAHEQMPEKIEDISITNSFGVPSKPVEVWQKDIDLANRAMAKNQLLIVSCVGTPGLKERNIIEDYALCAKLAVDAGAKAIELNFSCPNVVSKEGSVYQDAIVSSEITKTVKKAIGQIPLMIKIGYFNDINHLAFVLKANAPFVDGIACINTIPMKVKNNDGNQALPGENRLTSGICGAVIHNLALNMVEKIAEDKHKNNYDFIICGSGGVTKPEDFDQFLNRGADISMSATGAMWDPYLAYKWHENQS